MQPKSLCAYIYATHIYVNAPKTLTVRNANAMPNMQLQKLPIGEQSFSKLRRERKLYVDKTEFVYKLTQEDGAYFFLSRPRRFGKSLFLNTLEAYFLGKRELFDGLYIGEVEKDWFMHPVLHLDFSAESYNSEDALYEKLNTFLSKQEAIYGADASEKGLGSRFEGLIQRAYEQTGQGVVILVDEYDKPLLETMGNTELQEKYRSVLRGFYAALKSMDTYISFALLTGITKFSKISIFSDLNNLRDISREREYGSICGLTDAEVDRDLRLHIHRFAEKTGKEYEEVRADLQRMYDGYHFVADSEGLYNPFSIMCALSKGELGSYWFETGTPTMLVEMLQRKQYNLEELEDGVDSLSLDSKDGQSDDVVSLLYQSGYLSIKETSANGRTCWLMFPNEEVRDGFFRFLLPYYAQVKGGKTASEIDKFVADVREGRVEQFLQRLQAFFANFPYDAQKDSRTEEHFRNVMYILCQLLGLEVHVERKTSDGRIDLLIETEKYRYVIECKIDSTPAVALKQIHDKQYGLSWILDEKETILIGLNFSTTSRRPDGWIVERGDGTIFSSGKEGKDEIRGKDAPKRGKDEKRGKDGASKGVVKLLMAIEDKSLTVKELMVLLNLKGDDSFRKRYLKPALEGEYIAMLYPDAPTSGNQAYYMTEKGKQLLAK